MCQVQLSAHVIGVRRDGVRETLRPTQEEGEVGGPGSKTTEKTTVRDKRP